jgi:hypothetical protein
MYIKEKNRKELHVDGKVPQTDPTVQQDAAI